MKSRSGLIFLWFMAVIFWVMWLVKKNGNSFLIVGKCSNDVEECEEKVTESVQINSHKEDIDETCININTATLEELIRLPGIGKAIAQDIIDNRLENGLFQKIEDLERVKGLGPAKLSKIKDNISF
ncbi:MAG: ComEA family DNA-binding protein [Fibrobacter sp.]|jgi:competence protein ComEA|nr:ComEA family DNA-binding protein [Fibrobacter sp.]